MSILDNNSQNPADKAVRVANTIKGTTRQTFQRKTERSFISIINFVKLI